MMELILLFFNTFILSYLFFIVIQKEKVRKDKPEPLDLSRKEKKEKLCQYYCQTMAEDPVDGSMFDCAILDAINGVDVCQSQT